LPENLTLAALKDAARLLAYFAGTILLAALLAPFLFWGAQDLAAHGFLVFLATFDFETFFHRALLLAGLLLLWPLLRSIRLRRLSDLDLTPNRRWWRDLLAGFVLAAVPLLCCGAALVALHVYSWRWSLTGSALAKLVAASTIVPLIEETFFRGLLLGILLRSGRKYLSILVTSAIFSILHFLKAPQHTSPVVTWTSGFNSIAHSFAQFHDPLLVAAAFTTLFAIGWILADARVRTRSLWLPIGLHSGWILGNGIFNRMARRQILALPWVGKNLLVGIVPLAVCLLTWLLVLGWIRYDAKRRN
jgi:membrane protease YdiL (CAAX protease family)